MKVVFDGDHLLIKVNDGITTLDIQEDLYSDWKEWIAQGDNAKYLQALKTIGGDPTVGVKTVSPYFFLMNGWKIKPASWTHTLNLVGNLFIDDPQTYGDNIAIPPDGSYTVLINLSTTSDSIQVISGSGITEQDKNDISNLVWEHTEANILNDFTTGKMELDENDVLTIYNRNNPTEVIATYQLTRDSQGRIIKREQLYGKE